MGLKIITILGLWKSSVTLSTNIGFNNIRSNHTLISKSSFTILITIIIKKKIYKNLLSILAIIYDVTNK